MKPVPKIFLFCLVVGFALEAPAKVIDRIVAVVNNDVITQYDLDRAMAPRLAQANRSLNSQAPAQTLQSQVLDDLINQRLLSQEITKAKIEVSDEDLARAVANVLQKNQINIEILRAELAAKGISFEAYKEQLKEQIRQAKFIQQNMASQVQVTDQDVQKYKSSQAKPLNNNGTLHLASIYLPLDSEASAKDIRDAVRQGRKITDRARRGEDFAKLAQDYSKGLEAKQGGDMGTKSLSDLPGLVSSYVAKMKVGAVSDPIATPQGVYIVKVYEKSAQTTEELPATSQDEDQLRQAIYNQQMEQEMNNFVLRLRRKAYIDIRE